ncbi:TolC family outer membrane protein [Vibrio astriarenae]|uniref:TolC family outer membrane protein n=1 Tax=Vibrio astriarenae TaxID=1481923 RepID=A0A7Z2T5C8_9VIBR|nr:TolC family outer membrane protein [Vibrio astriarenae]QIA64709.1 TolC family outer membrane protein [Vibrio astriarenae]
MIALATSSTHAQTLEQAVAHTIKTNPSIKAQYNEFISKRYLRESSGGQYLPSIDLDAAIGTQDLEREAWDFGDYTGNEVSISLTQLLWDGNATLNDMDRTAADAESVRLQLLADAEDIALEVARIYLDATQAFELLALSEGNLRTHKKIYSDIKKRVDSGIGSTADLSQVEARVAKAHGNLLAAQNNMYDVHTEFTRVVGQAPQGLIYPRADNNFIPRTLQDAIDIAFEDHPVIQVSHADVDSAKFQYKQSKGVNLPTFTIEASQTWRDDMDGVIGSDDEASIMLRMRYNLYNGGSDVANQDNFAHQLNKAKDLRDSAYRQVEEGLRLAWSGLELTQQQKLFLADHVDSASATVVAYEKQYKIGKRTLLDVLNTENELFEARKEFLDAKYGEQYAKYRILNATGVLLDSLRVESPQEWQEKMEY